MQIDYHTNLHIIKIYTNIIIEWLWADNLLYEYFKKKFLSQRKAFGLQKLKHEHQILEQASNKVKDRCIEAQVENKYLAKNDRLYGHDVMGYKVRQNSGKDCPYYTMTEGNFVDYVRSIQRKKSIAKMKKHNVTKI